MIFGVGWALVLCVLGAWACTETGATGGGDALDSGQRSGDVFATDEWRHGGDEGGGSNGGLCSHEFLSDPVTRSTEGFSGSFQGVSSLNTALSNLKPPSSTDPNKRESRALLADLNRDGRLDLLYTRGVWNGELGWRLMQEESGEFGDPIPLEAQKAGEGNEKWRSISTCIFSHDLDGDGWEDIYCAARKQRIFWGDSEGVDWFGGTDLPDLDLGDGTVRDAAVWDLDADGLLDIVVSRWSTYSALGENQVFRNLGDRTFEEVSEAWNLNTGGMTWAVQFMDFDSDRNIDLYVMNDGPAIEANSNHALRNLGPGENGDPLFERVFPMPKSCDLRGIFWVGSTPMGGVLADFNADQSLDFLVALVGSNVILGQQDGAWGIGEGAINLPERPMGAEDSLVSWCPAVWDINQDGALDVVVPAGDDTGHGDDTKRGTSRIMLYRGTDSTDFVEVENVGLDDDGHFFTLSMGDLDGDLDLDLVIGGFDQPAKVYRNEIHAEGTHLLVELKGTTSNPHGIGARVIADFGEGKRAYVVGDRSCPGVSDRPLLDIASGPGETLQSLRVEWPSGYQQLLSPVEMGQRLLITEPEILRVVPSERHVPADGVSEVEIVVQALDETGAPMEGAEVALEAPFHPGVDWVGEASVGEDGAWSRRLRAPANPGSVVIEARINGTPLSLRPRIWFD